MNFTMGAETVAIYTFFLKFYVKRIRALQSRLFLNVLDSAETLSSFEAKRDDPFPHSDPLPFPLRSSNLKLR